MEQSQFTHHPPPRDPLPPQLGRGDHPRGRTRGNTLSTSVSNNPCAGGARLKGGKDCPSHYPAHSFASLCLTLASTLTLGSLLPSRLLPCSVRLDTRDWGCRDLRLRGPSVRFAGLASRPVPRYRPGRDFASIAFWGNFPNLKASK